MNAVTFFKSMGLKAVKQYLENDNIRTKEMHDELKQIVEAFELVESRGWLSEAKAIEQQYWNSGVGGAMFVAMELKEAINLVEQCNA